MNRLSFLVVVAAVAVAVAPAAAMQDRALVATFHHPTFGRVLTRPDGQALYFWSVEKRDFRIHCTGRCARVWPPLIVPRDAQAPRRVGNLKGRFGTIRRPDGRRQLTWNRLPVYTYAHEGRRQVLCNDVDGWFVVRV